MEAVTRNFHSATSFLPSDIYCQIFTHLSTFEITNNVALVCSLWARLSRHELLWKTIACQNYPICQNEKKTGWFEFYRSITLYLQRGAIILRKLNHADYFYHASDQNLIIWRISLKTARQQDLGSPIQHWHSIAHTDHQLPITALAIQSYKQGFFLITGSADTTVKIWLETKKGAFDLTCKSTLQHHKTPVTALKSYMNTIISGSEEGEMIVWRKRRGIYNPFSLAGHTSTITDLRFSNVETERRNVLYSASKDRTIRIWAIAPQGTGTCLNVIQLDQGFALTLAVNSHFKKFYAALSDGTIRQWSEDHDAITELTRFDFEAKAIHSLSNSENGDRLDLLNASGKGLVIKRFHLKSNENQFIQNSPSIQLNEPANKIFHSNAISFHEPFLYIYHQNQTISIYHHPFFSTSFEFVEKLAPLRS